MAITDPAMATTVAMRPATTAALRPHIMDMDMADHTTDGLIILHIARLTTVPTTVRVSTWWIGAAKKKLTAQAMPQTPLAGDVADRLRQRAA